MKGKTGRQGNGRDGGKELEITRSSEQNSSLKSPAVIMSPALDKEKMKPVTDVPQL